MQKSIADRAIPAVLAGHSAPGDKVWFLLHGHVPAQGEITRAKGALFWIQHKTLHCRASPAAAPAIWTSELDACIAAQDYMKRELADMAARVASLSHAPILEMEELP
jgi:hypothetical protein